MAQLPASVIEMRDAIRAAAQSGDIEELRVVLDWNELKPDIADTQPDDAIAYFRSISADREGREILAVLLDLIDQPYAVVPFGRDLENNKIFVWPRAAELPAAEWTGADKVGILRLAPADALATMIAKGRYSGWRLAIGADGTWHAFRKLD